MSHKPTFRLRLGGVGAVVLAAFGFVSAVRAAVAQDSVETDRAALEAIYDAVLGFRWSDSTNWMTAAPLGDWYGVGTDESGRVRSLELRRNGLTGDLPAELADLGRLEILDLAFNNLGGRIPPELGRLTRLQELRLGGNDLIGTIPRDLGRLQNLKTLGVEYNELWGTIPSGLSGLREITYLTLQNNHLSGRIPPGLGDLVNLTELKLYANNLSGPIPPELGRLVNLTEMELHRNHLSGPIPPALGGLSKLGVLNLTRNDLSGRVPPELGRLESLRRLDISFNWGLSGQFPLPPGMVENPSRSALDIFVTNVCTPASFRDQVAEMEFYGALCAEDDPERTVDLAVVYTPAAREAAGGTAGIEATVDLMVAETNQAYAESGVRHRLELVERSELQGYEETGRDDLDRLIDPDDGHLDEVHALRDRVSADLVHLIVARAPGLCGVATLPGVFALTVLDCGGIVMAHEIGHNMGLHHNRFQDALSPQGVFAHPAYGYVNLAALGGDRPGEPGWWTIMAYRTHCRFADVPCFPLLRFSNPRQSYDGDPLGVPYGAGRGGRGVTGPADSAAVLNVTMPAVAAWRGREDRADPRNRAPEVRGGALPDREIQLGRTLDLDLSPAFTDPDGDPLNYAVRSSLGDVVTAVPSGDARVRLMAVGVGTASVTVTAVDPSGLSARHSFDVTVTDRPMAPPFTDDPIRPGVTPVKAVHFTELRDRIDDLRAGAGLATVRWTDSVLRAGVTPIRLVHLVELRAALAETYAALGRPLPRWTDAVLRPGTTPIRAVHLTELREAVLALE